jgi:hypothetical protein
MRWVGHVALIGENRNVCRVSVGRPEAERPLQEIGIDGKVINLKQKARTWT